MNDQGLERLNPDQAVEPSMDTGSTAIKDVTGDTMYGEMDEEDRWAVKINTAWQKSIEGILETGSLLIQAKKACPHGGYQSMVRSRLPFSFQTAAKLMAIARNPVISNPAHVRDLPQAWGTLHELSKMDERELKAGVAWRLIKPEIKREDIPKIRNEIRRNLRLIVRKPKEEPKPHPSFFSLLRRRVPDLQKRLDELEPEAIHTIVDRVAALFEEETTRS